MAILRVIRMTSYGKSGQFAVVQVIWCSLPYPVWLQFQRVPVLMYTTCLSAICRPWCRPSDDRCPFRWLSALCPDLPCKHLSLTRVSPIIATLIFHSEVPFYSWENPVPPLAHPVFLDLETFIIIRFLFRTPECFFLEFFRSTFCCSFFVYCPDLCCHSALTNSILGTYKTKVSFVSICNRLTLSVSNGCGKKNQISCSFIFLFGKWNWGIKSEEETYERPNTLMICTMKY